jgi:anti-anti-sigma factor
VSTETNPATSPLQLAVHREGPAAVISFVGEFDFASVDLARAGLQEALHGDPDEVTIDLRGLSFIDSTGIAFLLTVAREDGDRLLRFLPSEAAAVRRVLKLTGVDDQLGGESAQDSLPADPDGC